MEKSNDTSSLEQPKSAYEPKVVESKWTQRWFDEGLFNLTIDQSKPNYSIALPPPNITGNLHMGHAFNGTLQDILVRRKRMQGYNVLWQPGTDHAGISTQMVVERKLMKEGRSRHDMTREAFLDEIWQWRRQYGDQIFNQYKRLGVSFAWERPAFTMDASYARAVNRAFVVLYCEGKIYRGTRLTNWCNSCLTSLSDLEVEEGHCERCHAAIEQRLSDQWYLRMDELAKPAMEAVRDGRIRFVPERYAPTYLDWLENVHDWNISRQLWWGHRIPIWTCENGHVDAYEAQPQGCAHCASARLEQDPDVLDTWFSSALWPFATLGWPDETPLLERFYPTAALSTAREIINLWVSRMIFMSLKFREQIPFSDILIHPVIQTPDGQRMSKSKGNAIDPLDMIEKYGTDAMRFYFASLGIKGDQDIRFREDRLGEYKKFANKIFNAARFIQTQLAGFQPDADQRFDRTKLTLADRWILHRYNSLLAAVASGLDAYDFHEVARQLYEFTWNDLCDWYLEVAKIQLGQENPGVGQTKNVLHTVFEGLLRAMHPIMPFITDELYEQFGGQGSLLLASYPEPDATLLDQSAERDMGLVIDCIRGLRDLRSTHKLPPAREAAVAIAGADDEMDLVRNAEPYLKRLARANPISYGSLEQLFERSASTRVSSLTVQLSLVSNAADAEQAKAKLSGRQVSLKKEIEKLQRTLDNPQFHAKAPKEKVEKMASALSELQAQLAIVESELKSHQ
jgi:valyl-tRNA synthetase